MPFICKRRSDIPNGTLQITDFWPNKSQANAAIDPQPQGPRYVNGPQTETPYLLSTGGNQRYFARAQSGLAPYLVANVQVGAAGPALTPTQANAAATAIIAAMAGGATLNLAAINAILDGVAGGATLTGNNSTGAVMDVLRILAGATYTVPAGTVVRLVGGAFNPQTNPAAWNASNFDFDTFKDVLTSDSSFYISLAEGQINGFTSPHFSYLGTTGAALVVYDNTGDVL